MSLYEETQSKIYVKYRVRKRKCYTHSEIKKRVKFEDEGLDETDLKCYENLDNLNHVHEKEANHENSKEEEKKVEDVKNDTGNSDKRLPCLPPPCHCIECFAYMGEMNPRQYCRKWHCDSEYYNEEEILQQQVFNLRASPYYNDFSFWGYKEYRDVIQDFIDKNYIESVSELEDNLDDNSS